MLNRTTQTKEDTLLKEKSDNDWGTIKIGHILLKKTGDEWRNKAKKRTHY